MLLARSDAPKPPSNEPTRGPGLAELRVLGRDRQVADEVEDVAAADGVARDHRDHGLRQAADLHVEVADVQAPDALLRDLVIADVAVIAADALVAARAERLVAGAREDDRADLGVVARAVEGVAKLGQGLRAEGVPDLWPVDRDLRDPVALLVEEVAVLMSRCPLDRRIEAVLGRGVSVSDRHVGDYGGVRATVRQTWLAQRAAAMPERLALRAGGGGPHASPSCSMRPSRPPPALTGQGAAVGSIVPLECAPKRRSSSPSSTPRRAWAQSPLEPHGARARSATASPPGETSIAPR